MHRFRFPLHKSCRCIRRFTTQSTRLENVGTMASLLKSRTVIRFRGPDNVRFLQGLLTNDLRKFEEPVGEKTFAMPTPNMPITTIPPVYAAMLTPQGRFLYDFFVYKPSQPHEMLDRTGSGPGSDARELELYADVDRVVLDELLTSLKKYRLRSKVDIENVGEEYSCWQRYGGNLQGSSSSEEEEEPEAACVGWGGGVDQTGVSASHGNNLGWQWHKDPRLDCLGFRGIFPYNTTPPMVEADKEADEGNYRLWRIEKGVAEGSIDIPKGEAIPLEYNLAGLNAISFDKGCYIGQELIARTHHRGVIRKRLLPLKFVDDEGQEVGEKVAPGAEVVHTTSSSGKKTGNVTTAIGCRGLGILRLDEALKGSNSLAIQGLENVKVRAFIPEWWPSEWYSEYQRVTAVP